MTYEITRIINARGEIPITEEEFEKIAFARRALLESLAIEDKLDMLLENFADGERTLLELSVHHLLFAGQGWTETRGDLQTVNRRLINLFSTCRMYVDHLPHNLGNVFGKHSEQVTSFKEATSKEYDSSLGYRALYALRNFVQHRGFPVHSLTHQGRRQDHDTGTTWRNTLTGFISVEQLAQEKQFKQEILDELRTMGDKIDIKPLMRQCLVSIGKIHGVVRELLRTHIEEWEHLLKSVIERFQKEFGDVLGLAVVARDDSGRLASKHPIFDDFWERRKYLENKNRNLTHLEWHYVSSEIVVD